MSKQIWGRPLQPTKLPVVGGATGLAVLAGALILYWRRRHASGIEIKVVDDAIGSVIHETNSPELAQVLLLMGTRHRKTLANTFSGRGTIDPKEYNRSIRQFRRESRRLKRGQPTIARWQLSHHLSSWLHRQH